MTVIKLSEYYSDDQTKKARIDKVEDRKNYYKLFLWMMKILLK